MYKILILWVALATTITASYVASISKCPLLIPRDIEPANITDLRVDDIKIFGALGDSMLAGYGVNNVNPGIFGLLNATSLIEYRGLSYLMGGDPDATTVANFMKHYNSLFHGSSTGFHELRRFQKGKPNPYLVKVDNLNAAKSAARAQDLNFELDYLQEGINQAPLSMGRNVSDTWKMITIQIGGNDLCTSCRSEFSNITSAKAYGDYIENAINRLQKFFPNKTLVNLMGMFNITDLNQLASKNQNYCRNRSILKLCSCLHSPENIENIAELAQEYDNQLNRIAKKYAPKFGNTFGVIFTPLPVDISSAPVEILSNIDCFHPSLLGHEWLAKVTWNQFFVKKELKPLIIRYNKSEEIYCPTEKDRLQLI